MAACLFVLGSKEAESILIRSEHLLHKVTPTGLACADPTAYKVRLLTGNGDFQLALKSLSSSVGRILITISKAGLPGCNSFSLLLITGGRMQVFLLWDWWLQFVFLGLPPPLRQAAAGPEEPSWRFRVSRLLLSWPRFSAFLLNTVLILRPFSFHAA